MVVSVSSPSKLYFLFISCLISCMTLSLLTLSQEQDKLINTEQNYASCCRWDWRLKKERRSRMEEEDSITSTEWGVRKGPPFLGWSIQLIGSMELSFCQITCDSRPQYIECWHHRKTPRERLVDTFFTKKDFCNKSYKQGYRQHVKRGITLPSKGLSKLVLFSIVMYRCETGPSKRGWVLAIWPSSEWHLKHMYLNILRARGSSQSVDDAGMLVAEHLKADRGMVWGGRRGGSDGEHMYTCGDFCWCI